MAATAEQIGRLRRMAGEVGGTTYSDGDLATYIERYPCVDVRGEKPYELDISTNPPTQEANEDWIATYDLNAAAADVWSEKAGLLVKNFDFSADGGNYSRSQAHEMAMQQSRYYAARRQPSTTMQHVYPQPRPETMSRREPWIANLAEEDD